MFALTLIEEWRKRQPSSYILKLHEVEVYLELMKAYPQASYRLDQLKDLDHPNLTQEWIQWDIRRRITDLIDSTKDAAIELGVIRYE